MNLFASRLRARAAELGVSHSEAARRSGLSEGRYSNYVNGKREPDLATLIRIATALRTTPNDLLGIEEKQKPSQRPLLMERLNAAGKGLAEALAGPRRKRRRS